ncbi:hypothetical protein EYC84_007248 [Monilinia fructicola]|uniref:Uncharacterized protein n=1 Tax=Monilinia fructicola TaxID=38448 RepID=A0A5M9KA94_MONFR|nr:hypothetical protein EYC84_007248 [Monilinia fructicola]
MEPRTSDHPHLLSQQPQPTIVIIELDFEHDTAGSEAEDAGAHLHLDYYIIIAESLNILFSFLYINTTIINTIHAILLSNNFKTPHLKNFKKNP